MEATPPHGLTCELIPSTTRPSAANPDTTTVVPYSTHNIHCYGYRRTRPSNNMLVDAPSKEPPNATWYEGGHSLQYMWGPRPKYRTTTQSSSSHVVIDLARLSPAPPRLPAVPGDTMVGVMAEKGCWNLRGAGSLFCFRCDSRGAKWLWADSIVASIYWRLVSRHSQMPCFGTVVVFATTTMAERGCPYF